VLEHFQG